MGAAATPPKIPPPPAPPDETKAFFREINRRAMDQKIRRTKGRGGMFGAGYLGGDSTPPGLGEPYRAPGMSTLMGGGG